MVQLLENNVHWWSSWAEGCACHEHLRQGGRSGGSPEHLRQLREELGHSLTCPLANMRLPELVVCMLGLGDIQRP
eukprot:142506-Amphidinium_carterae.1